MKRQNNTQPICKKQFITSEDRPKVHSTQRAAEKNSLLPKGTPMKATPENNWSNKATKVVLDKDDAEEIIAELWNPQSTEKKQYCSSFEGDKKHNDSLTASSNKHKFSQASNNRQNLVQVGKNINSLQDSDCRPNTNNLSQTRKRSQSLGRCDNRSTTAESANRQLPSNLIALLPEEHKANFRVFPENTTSQQQLLDASWSKDHNSKDRCRKQEENNCDQQQVNLVTNQLAVTVTNIDHHHKQIKVQGFRNLGNSCYFNAVVQCLCHTPGLASVLGHGVRPNDSNKPLTKKLLCLMEALEQNNTVDTGHFHRELFEETRRKFPKFANSNQHDSHDLLQCLLEGIKEEDRSPRGTNGALNDSCRTSIDQLFGGSFFTLLHCTACKQVSHCIQPFRDIQVPLAEQWNDQTLNGSRSLSIAATGYGTPSLSVEYGLTMATSVEGVTEPFRAFCQQCHDKQMIHLQAEPQERQKTRTTRRMNILQPPSILVLHLNRFNLDEMPRKIEHEVKFETRFNLGPHCIVDLLGLSSPTLYDLYAVVEHSGSIRGGHYTAYVKVTSPTNSSLGLMSQRDAYGVNNSRIGSIANQPHDDHDCFYDAVTGEEESCKSQWYRVSDAYITPCSEQDVKKCCAFLLFYKRIF